MCVSIHANATIVDGVRQQPEYQYASFQTDTEVYLLHVASGKFFTQGNSWGTQASIGDEPRKLRFSELSDGVYTIQCYCWRDANQQGGTLSAAWRAVFFDSETALFVDRSGQTNYYFNVMDNSNGTYRLTPAVENPQYGVYTNSYFVGMENGTTSTALSPFLLPEDGAVDWAIILVDEYDRAWSVYRTAQTLKNYIDQIKEQGKDATEYEAVYLNESSTLDELNAAIAAARVTLLGDDVTQYIANPGFDQDITFGSDGSWKPKVQTQTLSNRSEAWIAADNSVYAHTLASSSQSRADGRKDEAVNGFIGQIEGWTMESNKAFPECEWVYFGSVPYDLAYQSIPISDDGDTYLEVPEKPDADNGDDNKAFVYLRAGWGGRAVYKQTVKLPCAKYHLEYYAINLNPSGKNGTNLSKVTCRS